MSVRARLMVVEDNRIVARDISEQLGRIGHTVIGVTASGEAAVALAASSRPDLILMDVRLEGRIDGIDAAREIRATSQIPVVFLTAYADDETIRRAGAAEPFGYLLKPFEDLQLRTVIEMALHRRRAEEALRAAQADIARMSRLTTMGQLTATIAHEVNQPLMAVAMNAEACVRWLEPGRSDIAEARAAAERAIDEAHRAGAIIARVRSVARNAPISIETLDLNETIENTLLIVRPELNGKGVGLDTDLHDAPLLVMGDGVLLQQVILNLISNAADAVMASAGMEPRIVVSSRLESADEVFVAVDDTGAGIDAGLRDQIFEPFFTTKADGIGMGLAICRSVITAHHGQLWSEPHQPRGTRLCFKLPRCQIKAPT
jgi:C4-dicarboxylate-specific signal transduction histidine kinase